MSVGQCDSIIIIGDESSKRSCAAQKKCMDASATTPCLTPPIKLHIDSLSPDLLCEDHENALLFGHLH